MEHNRKRLTSSADYLVARGCYEKILQINPRNVKACIDLGDHYRNLCANNRALEHYNSAFELLQHAPREGDWREDAQELLEAIALLKEHDRLAAAAASLEERISLIQATLQGFDRLERAP